MFTKQSYKLFPRYKKGHRHINIITANINTITLFSRMTFRAQKLRRIRFLRGQEDA